MTLGIRRTWEFLQSFEFRHKREKLMLRNTEEVVWSCDLFTLLADYLWKLKCFPDIKVVFPVKCACICVSQWHRWLTLWNHVCTPALPNHPPNIFILQGITFSQLYSWDPPLHGRTIICWITNLCTWKVVVVHVGVFLHSPLQLNQQ